MKPTLLKRNSLIVVFWAFFLIAANKTFAVTYYLQVAGAPQTAANWNTLPGGGGAAAANFTTAGDLFIIDNDAATLGNNLTLGAGVNLQIDATGSLDPSNRNLTVGGTTTIAGTFSDGNAAAGTNTFTGLVTNSGTFSHTANNVARLVFSGGFTNTGTFTIDRCTMTGTFTGTAAMNFPGTIATGGSVILDGTINFTGTGNVPFGTNLQVALGGVVTVSTTGTLSVTGTTTILGSFTDSENSATSTFTGLVTLTSGSMDMSVISTANCIMNGGITITAGTFNVPNVTIGLAGARVITATSAWSPTQITFTGASQVTFAGAGGVTVGGTSAFAVPQNLVVTGGLTVATTGVFTVAGTTTISGTGNLTDNDNTAATTFTGLVTLTAGTLDFSAVTTTANCVMNGGVTYTAGTFTVPNVTLATGQTVTATSPITWSANNIAFTGTATMTFTGAGGTTINGTASVIIPQNLSIGGPLVIATTGDFTVTGTTALTAAASSFTDNDNTGISTFTGLVTKTNGTWTSTAVTTPANMVFSAGFTNFAGTFNGGAVTVGAGQTLTANTAGMGFAGPMVSSGNLLFSGLSLITNSAGNSTITGDLTVGAGGFTKSGGDISIGGNLSWSAGTVTVSTTGNFSVTGTTSITGSGAFLDNENTGISTFTGLVTKNTSGAWTSSAVTTAANMVFTAGFTNTLGAFTGGAATIGAGQTITPTVAMGFAGAIVCTGNLIIANGALVTNSAGNSSVTGDLSVGNGGLTKSGGNFTIGGNLSWIAGTITLSTTGDFTVTGTTSVTGSGAFTDSENTGITTFTGAVTKNSTGNWTSTTVTTAANMIFSNGISNDGTGTFNAGAATFNINNQALSGATAYSFANPVIISGAITLTNQSSNATGITFTSTLDGTVAGSTYINAAGRRTNYNNATQPMATGALDASAINNDFYYALGGIQTMKYAAAGYYNLYIATSGTKTLTMTANQNVLGILNVATTTIFSVDGAFTFSVAGSSTIAGTCGPTNVATIISLVDVNLSGGQLGNGVTGTINVTGNLTLPTGNAILQRSNITITGTTNVDATRTLTLNNDNGVKTFIGAITVDGTWTSTAVATTANCIIRNGVTNNNVAAASFAAGGVTFSTNNQILAGVGQFTFANPVLISGAISLTNNSSYATGLTFNSTIDGDNASSEYINAAGRRTNYQPAATTIPMATGILTASALNNDFYYSRNNNQTVKQTPGGYYNLFITGGGGTKTLTMASNEIVAGTLTVANATTFSIDGAHTFSVTGLTTNDGVLAPINAATVLSLADVNLSGGQLGNGVTGTINIAGNLTMPTGNAVLAQSTITVSGTTTVATTRSLTISTGAGVKTFIGAIDIQGTGTWTSTGVGAASVIIRGGISNANTFNAGGVTFNTNNQSLSGAGTYTFNNPTLISGARTITNNCSNVAGILFNSTLDGDDAASTWLQGNNSLVRFANNTRPFATLGVLDAYTPTETNEVRYSANNNSVYRGNEYFNITFNGTGTATLTTSVTTVYGTLLLQTASLNNTAGILTMAAGSTIERYNTEALTNAPTFSTSVNIIYRNGDLTTGPEMPTSTTVLNNLTVNVASGNVTLGAAVTCNGICTLTSGKITLSNFNFTLGNTGTITGTFDNTKMLVCNGTGKLIKKGAVAADFVMTYPIGTTPTGVVFYYTPMTISAFAGAVGGGAEITVLPKTPAHPLTIAPVPYNATLKYWTVTTTGLTGVNSTITFQYDDVEIFGTESSYEPVVVRSGTFNTVPGPSTNNAANTFTSTGATETDLNGDWLARDPSAATPRSWYSYQSGDWADPLNWTLTVGIYDNPGSNYPSQSAIDDITIQSNHTIFTNINRTVTATVLQADGVLDIKTNVASNLGTVTGTGTLRINTFSIPTGTFTSFVAVGGGTFEYYDIASGNLPSQSTYCNLLLTNSTGSNLTYSLQNPSNPTTYTINGTLTTSRSGAGTMTLTLGNVVTNAINLNVTGVLTNGAGCTINCYNNNPGPIHTITCSNDLINNGTFDVANNAQYSTATTGAAHVVFNGLSNNNFTCNGTTEVYSLTVNKGTDQTYTLNLTAPTGSFLFTNNGAAGANGIAITNGTLILGTGITINNRLAGNNGNLNISSAANNNGCLKIDGATVTTQHSIRVFGKLWMVSGTLNIGTNGVNLESGSEFLMEGGTLTAEGFINGGGGATVATFTMTGGTLNVDNSQFGTGQTDVARFSLPSATVTFIMSGGTINVRNPINAANCTNGGLHLRSAIGNYSITGGTWNLYIPALSTGSDNFYINTTVPFYDLNILSQGAGTCVAKIETIGGEVVTTPQAITVLHDLTIGNGTDAPTFDANGYGITVGGNITVNAGASFVSKGNTITLNGPQTYGRTNQDITLNTTVSNSTSLTINKASGTATMAGTGNFQNVNNLTLTSGTFADGGKTLDVTGNIINSASHTGAGAIRVQRGIRSTSGVPAPTYTLPTLTSTDAVVPTTHATFALTIKNGVVTGISIAPGGGGAGYGGAQYHTIAVAGGNGVGLQVRAERAGGALISAWIIDGGTGYATSASDAGDGGGSGATFDAVVTGNANNTGGTGTLTSVVVTSTGEGYTGDCTVNLSASGATPATTCIGESDTAPTIGGSGFGTFTNFSLNNDITGGGAVFTANQTVNGNLRLLNGILDIDNYSLTLGTSTNIYSDAAVGTTFSNTKMIATNALSSDAGVTKNFNSTSFTFPIGVGSRYTPNTISFSSAPTVYGAVAVKPVDTEHPLVSATGQSLTYYWKVASTGFTLGAATVTQTFTYDQTDVVDNGTTVLETEYVPGKFDISTVAWIPNPDNTKVDDAVNNIITFDGALYNTAIDGDYTAGDQTPADPFAAVFTYYSRNGSTFDWNDPTAWSIDGTLKHIGAAAVSAPTANSVVRIGDGVTYNHTVVVDANTQACGSLLIATGSTLNLGTTTGHNFGVYITPTGGNGTLRISSADATADFPAGDFSAFNGLTGGTVEYYTTGAQDFDIPATSDAPSSVSLTQYYNLILTPGTGRYIQMPDLNQTIHNSMTVQGASATGLVRLNTATTRTLTVTNDLLINSGNLQFRNGTLQNIVVTDDIVVETGAIFNMENAGALINTLSIGGSLTVNGTGNFDMTQSATRACATTFIGTGNETIGGTGGTIDFHTVNVNKGTTQAPLLEVTFAGTFTVPTTYEWLTLTNGTFRYNKLGGTLTVSNNTVRNNFTIPETACLSIGAGATAVRVVYFSNNTSRDLFLTGKLEVLGGTMSIGDPSRDANCDIEIDQAGAPTIDVQGSGTLFVLGQIRRSTATAAGALVYSQSGSSQVTIAGRGVSAAQLTRGKLEICNAGSSFNMTGTSTLEIRRGNGTDGTFGDLYIAPTLASAVSSGTTIKFANASVASNEVFGLNTSINLANITVDGLDASNTAEARILVNPITMTGNLIINDQFSVFNANSFNLTIGGNLTNSNTDASNGVTVGGYRAGAVTQVTTFNGSGVAQTITGSAAPNNTNFGRLVINSTAGTLTLAASTAIRVNENLTLTTALDDGGNTMSVLGNTTINAAHTGLGKIALIGTSAQTITGTGSFTNIELNNTSGTDVASLSNLTINGTLTLTTGKFNISAYRLTLGANATAIAGASSTRFIRANGSPTDEGVRKMYNNGVGTTITYTFPVGVGNNYRPAAYTGTATTASAYLNLKQNNGAHPSTQDPLNTELLAYWSVATSGMSAISVTHDYSYLDADVQGTEATYVTGRFASGDWSPGLGDEAGTSVTPASNLITWTTKAYLDGDYTAGYPNEFAALVSYYSRNATLGGNWTDANSWSTDAILQHAGAAAATPPVGSKIYIASGHTIVVDANIRKASTIDLAGTLDCGSTIGHIFGDITNSGGTIRITSTGGGALTLPTATYTTFVSASGGTFHFIGNVNCNLPLSLTQYRNLIIDGSATKTMSNTDLSILGNITFANTVGNILSNTTNNRNITIAGNWNNNLGATAFAPGTGTVIFNGTTNQTIGGTATAQTFNNITVSKTAGTTLSKSGSTVTLTCNDYTNTQGNFDASGFTTALNINSTVGSSDVVLTTGTFTAPATINITGNWSNNGGTFVQGTGTVNFTGNAAQAIGGTTVSQTFNNLVVNKSAGTLSKGGSTVTLTCNSYTNTAGTFNATGFTTAFNVNASASGSNVVLTAGTFQAPATMNVTGNWTNNGGTFTPGTGTVNLTSTAAQTIGGSANTTFNNLTINNSSATGVTLSRPTTASGTLTLTDGFLYTDGTNLMIIANGGSASSGSAGSYVAGPMKKIGTTSFIFPIGNALGTKWARLGMNVVSGYDATTEFTASYFSAGGGNNTAPFMNGGLDHVSFIESWDLSRALDPGNNASCNVALYYESASQSGIGSASDTRVAHFDGTTSKWENMGGGGASPITSTVPFTSFSPITFGSVVAPGINPLPIELISFDAKANKNKQVDLTWVTASEKNNSYFTIERSANGTEFEPIEIVSSKAIGGNSSSILNYSTVDKKPFSGVSYYKLKQTDFDGTSKYSNVVAVNIEDEENTFDIYPNPVDAGNTINLRLNYPDQKSVLVVLLDINGKKIYSKVIVVEKGNDTVTAIDLEEKIAAGVYTIVATSDNSIYKQKLIIR